MDIRKYFGAPSSGPVQKKLKATKKNPVIYDSDDEDPLPTKIRNKRSKMIVLASDSESDENNNPPRAKKKKDAPKSPPAKKTPAKKTPAKKAPAKSMKSDSVNKKSPISSFFGKSFSKPTTAEDFFGSGPIRQSRAKSENKKGAVTMPSLKRTEKHHDEDFDKTLKQVDECDIAPTRKNLKLDAGASGKAYVTNSLAKETEAAGKVQEVKRNHLKIGTASKLSKKLKASEKAECKSNEPVTQEQQVAPPPVDTKKAVKERSDSKFELQAGTSSKEAGEESDLKINSEKKKKTFLNYQKYLHRQGPKAHGSKEIPEGAENCLEGITFVITGVLESLERDEAKSLIERYGGKVTTNVSKNTKYLLVGEDAGPSKLEKAEKLSTKQISEAELLELIKSLPGKKSKYEIEFEESVKKSGNRKKKAAEDASDARSKVMKLVDHPKPTSDTDSLQSAEKDGPTSVMWVDKYRPKTIKEIIGQHGENSNANKLLHWLKNWHKNCMGSEKKKINYAMKWKDVTGASFKAALLSGSPGVGKTTTAHVVCKEAGYSFVEMNASDTRSKKSLEQHVSSLVSNSAINKYYGGKEDPCQRNALIMDEVDGMAGNEDRGGVQELIQLMKSSKIPIICICNDKSLPKMRSLLNYCFDLAFQKPRVQQIKGAMMSVAFKEGLKIAPPALQEIIIGANQDIRQIIHNLSVWSANDKSMTYDQAKAEAKSAQKHVRMGPFDVLRKVFSGGDGIKTINDKSDLFFHDYSIGPLFVQENYLQVKPRLANNIKGHLKLISAAADSICDGDLVERTIRSRNSWSLLPLQAMYSSVLPGEYVRGHLTGMINFPSWLGKNSSRGKIDRVIQELQQHSRLHISANKTELGIDYCSHLKNKILKPLITREADGVGEAVNVMSAYSLLREDLDFLLDVCTWSNSRNEFTSLSPKVKAAFTRTYNKEAALKPYSVKATIKKSRGAALPSLDEFPLENEEMDGNGSADEEENIDNDAMIKVKSAASNTNKKASSKNPKKGSKGKNRN